MAKLIDEYSKRNLAEGLAVLSSTQAAVGSAVPGWVEGEPEFVRTTFLALIVEITELLQLFNWKQWKFPVDISGTVKGEMMDEFADVLAFTGYIIIFLGKLGISPEMLAQAYKAKTEINIPRLGGDVKGYGVQDES